ncbi:unnamed protein product [Echinostoma caproni]|uniref:Uncharacterized protein n=1 Tax=Echinostoma caproni TaxID=27848 RepID=A0A183BE15_9TREM|nr:unnamed protein product [Echinostoma caproni]
MEAWSWSVRILMCRITPTRDARCVRVSNPTESSQSSRTPSYRIGPGLGSFLKVHETGTSNVDIPANLSPPKSDYQSVEQPGDDPSSVFNLLDDGESPLFCIRISW